MIPPLPQRPCGLSISANEPNEPFANDSASRSNRLSERGRTVGLAIQHMPTWGHWPGPTKSTATSCGVFDRSGSEEKVWKMKSKEACPYMKAVLFNPSCVVYDLNWFNYINLMSLHQWNLANQSTPCEPKRPRPVQRVCIYSIRTAFTAWLCTPALRSLLVHFLQSSSLPGSRFTWCFTGVSQVFHGWIPGESQYHQFNVFLNNIG